MTKPAASELDTVAAFRKQLYYTCPVAHFVAVPNASKRGPRAVRQAKREGMKAGFPDGFVLWPGGGICFLEFKRATGGKTSDNQAEWLLRLKSYGFPVALVCSADEAINVLRQCGAPFLEEAA